MKKIVMAVMLCTVLCAAVFAQKESDFAADANGVITKYTGWDTVIVIPATIGGKTITGIGKEAFLRADITSVTIPEGVTSIGESAFSGNKLTSVTIPNSVTSIGNGAFANNRLTRVTIPGSVKRIDGNAFRGNTALATIVISEGVESIGSGAFANTKCTSVSLPSTASFTDDAFDLSNKPSFTLAANIKDSFDFIPAFYSYIANDRKAGTYAFNLPLVSKKTEDYEYYETRYGVVLTVYTGNSTRARIPAEIGKVAVKALYGTPYRYGFEGVFQKKKLAAVQIPESITYIGDSAFSGNELENVTIPNSVTYIGNSAFSGNKLTGVTIPNSVTSIGQHAFRDNQLTSVTIPNSVTTIGHSAFAECTSLASVTIPNSVTSIGEYAFYGCTSLTSVTFQGTISSANFKVGNYPTFPGDLRDKYLAGNGGPGTYTRAANGSTWTKQ